MHLPTLYNRTCPFPILGVLGGIIHFCPNSIRTVCMQTVETLAIPQVLRRLNGLGLYCLPMSHKKDGKIPYAYMVNCNLVLCVFFSSFPRETMGLSVICDYGSYSLALF